MVLGLLVLATYWASCLGFRIAVSTYPTKADDLDILPYYIPLDSTKFTILYCIILLHYMLDLLYFTIAYDIVLHYARQEYISRARGQ